MSAVSPSSPDLNELHHLEYNPYAPDHATPATNTHETESNPSKAEVSSTPPPITITEKQGVIVGIKWYLALPALVVVAISAGLGTLLLVWLLKHQTADRGSPIQSGAFELLEGIKDEGDVQTARLTGLTISSAAAFIISFTTPFLMSLFAYRVAAKWLKASKSAKGGSHPGLPTPLQFGLMSSLLSAPTLLSIFSSTHYFCIRKRAKSPVSLKEAFAVAVLVYAVSHTVGAMDIWLHAVTSTVILPSATQTTPFNYTVAQNSCLPYPAEWWLRTYQCLFGPGVWAQDGVELGKLVSSNISSDLRAITLADNENMAVLVRPNIAQEIAFTMFTFGAKASCKSLNAQCGASQSPPEVNCTSSGIPDFPPALRNTSAAGLGVTASPGASTAFLLTATCEGCQPVPPSEGTGLLSGVTGAPPPVNPIRVLAQFVWQQVGDQPWPTDHNNTATTIIMDSWKTMLADCTLGFYNVTLDYYNGTYSLANAVLSNTGLSDGLAGPTSLAHYANRLMGNIEGLALTSSSANDTIGLLNQELGRLSIASAAVITDLAQDTVGNQVLSTQLLGRYPAVPALLLVTFLYLYAALALLIFINVSLTTRSTMVTSPQLPGERIATMELAQLPLAQPLALVAEMFPPRDLERKVRLSMTSTALDRFEESGGDSSAIERMRIGVHPSDVEGTSIFGIWRRTGHDKDEP